MAVAELGQAQSVRQYELWGELAAGGMASVYLARVRGEAGFQQWVAVKRCHPHLTRTSEFRNMLLEEAQLAARIHHPNVVSTVDVVQGDALCLVMDYVEGGSLAELLAAGAAAQTPLPIPVVLRILIDACAGLNAAHDLHDDEGHLLELVHRDVSPQNVLVSTAGVARLADFGIAKARSRVSHTETGQVRGKLAYVAPELLSGAPCTRSVDIYGLGVVLWESLAGQRLFHGSSEAELIDRVLRNLIPDVSQRRPGIPPALAAVVKKATARDPAARFATAAQMGKALEDVGMAPATATTVGEQVKSLLASALAERAALKTSRIPSVHTADVQPSRMLLGTALTTLGTPTRPVHRTRSVARFAAVGVLLLVAGVGLGFFVRPASMASGTGAAAGSPLRATVPSVSAAVPLGAPREDPAKGLPQSDGLKLAPFDSAQGEGEGSSAAGAREGPAAQGEQDADAAKAGQAAGSPAGAKHLSAKAHKLRVVKAPAPRPKPIRAHVFKGSGPGTKSAQSFEPDSV